MTIGCDIIADLQWASATSAGIAALFWFLSSIGKLPPDQITWNTIDSIIPAIRRQGKLNAIAAVFAGVAAAIQAALIMMPTCIKLS